MNNPDQLSQSPCRRIYGRSPATALAPLMPEKIDAAETAKFMKGQPGNIKVSPTYNQATA